MGDEPGVCMPCDYGTYRAEGMNDTFCMQCEGPADYYTTDIDMDDMQDMGASNSSHCRGKRKIVSLFHW